MALSSALILGIVYTSGIYLSIILLLSKEVDEFRKFVLSYTKKRGTEIKKKYLSNPKLKYAFYLLFLGLKFIEGLVSCNVCFSFWVNLFWLLYVNFMFDLLSFFELLSFSFLFTIVSIILYGIIKIIFGEK